MNLNSNDDVKINKKYKDRLFRFIFGAPENKEYLLSLYNAMNDSHYLNADDIEITTLEDIIYIKMKNDVSFLIDSVMNLYEHQSTLNPNMPLRGFLYFADLFRQYLSTQSTKFQRDLHSMTQIPIPVPEYIVFYNGDRECDDYLEMKLSDAFEFPRADGKYEWTAKIYNINAGHNNP